MNKIEQVPNMTTQHPKNVHKFSHLFKNLVNSFLYNQQQQTPNNNIIINPNIETVMCNTKKSIDATTPPSSRHSNHHKQPTPTTSTTFEQPSTSSTTSSSHSSSRRSLSSIRSSLPENPHLYDISEIRTATNNFLSKSSFSSSTSRCWRCMLHGKPVLIVQRKSHHPRALRKTYIRKKLHSICKSHHVAIVNLLGACISGEYIYLVYDFISGSNLNDLLRNKNNPNYTVLDTWMSRMQVATDLANGLDYIHNNTGLDVTFIHNHIKSCSVIVTEPLFNAKICHFGTAVLCGEPTEEVQNSHFFDGNTNDHKVEDIIIDEEKGTSSAKKLTRLNSMKFNGTTGYMSPEFQMTGIGTRKSDVYSFGVVLVELISGEEAVKYKYNKVKKEYIKISAVDAAREVVADCGGGGGRLRKWVDSRLKDSYPVEVAEKMTRLAVECLQEEADKRPDMRRIAGKISKLYLESKAWCDKLKIPTDITVSFAPR